MLTTDQYERCEHTAENNGEDDNEDKYDEFCFDFDLLGQAATAGAEDSGAAAE